MTDTIDITELEKEMMELFDDYGYNQEQKTQKENMKKSLDDISDEHDVDIDMNYISTSNNNDYTAVNMNVVPIRKTEKTDLVGKDFVNNILNDKPTESPRKKISFVKHNNDFLLNELDSESKEKIKNGLYNENSDIYSSMEENNEIALHINKLLLIKEKVYKSYFKKRRRSSTTSVGSDTEIELNANDIQYAIDKENELIGILFKNIKRYLIENDIHYSDKLFDLNYYDGYKIVDNPNDEITSNPGIVFINIVENEKELGKYTCYRNKCIGVHMKKNMIVTTKDFHKFRYVNTNKILLKKIKMEDICYLIEKHKK